MILSRITACREIRMQYRMPGGMRFAYFERNVSMRIIHPIPALYDSTSTVLILGSFPSVKTRESGFFYGHPQNRFWKVISALFDEPLPANVSERRSLLVRHHIAAWDVIHACDIEGSSDASIRNVVANDLSPILSAAPIRQIFVNGKTAEKMYKKYILPACGIECICLPSTSPANAAWSLEKLIGAWSVIKEQHKW